MKNKQKIDLIVKALAKNGILVEGLPYKLNTSIATDQQERLILSKMPKESRMEELGKVMKSIGEEITKSEELPTDNWFVRYNYDTGWLINDFFADEFVEYNENYVFGLVNGEKYSTSVGCENRYSWKEVTTEQFKRIIAREEVDFSEPVKEPENVLVTNHGKLGNYKNEEKPKFKKGDRVRIIANTNGHGLELNEIVEVSSVKPHQHYFMAESGDGRWWCVRFTDAELYNPETYMGFEVKKYEEPYPIVEVSDYEYEEWYLSYLKAIDLEASHKVKTTGGNWRYIRPVPTGKRNFGETNLK